MLPFSLTLVENDLVLLNNEVVINFLNFGQSTRALIQNERKKRRFWECQWLHGAKNVKVSLTRSQKCQTPSRD